MVSPITGRLVLELEAEGEKKGEYAFDKRFAIAQELIIGRFVLKVDGNGPVFAGLSKKQQMQWSKSGAHLLLQTRVKTLDGELGAVFKRWYSDMDIEVEEMPTAA